MVRAWNIRFKNGKPVINIMTTNMRPLKTLEVKSKDIKITTEGLKVGDYDCRFDRLLYNTVPAPLEMVEVNNKQPHILYLVYEIISIYFHNKSSVVVKKIPFDIAKIVAKYPEFNVDAKVFKYFLG